jgi:hypothetical protein
MVIKAPLNILTCYDMKCGLLMARHVCSTLLYMQIGFPCADRSVVHRTTVRHVAREVKVL